MKNYPEDIELVLGIDQVRARIWKECASQRGKELVHSMQISSSSKQIELWLNQVAEYKTILQSNTSPTISASDLRPSIDKITLEKRILDVDDLIIVRQICQESQQVFAFFDAHQLVYPNIFAFIEGISVPEELVLRIDEVFDTDGRWKRNASKKLGDTLQDIDRHEKLAYNTLHKIYAKAQESGWTADTGITVKEGRLVIPVFAENKRKIQGIVHDESGGGKILYIEPLEVLDSTNRIRELELERDREMRKILTKLTTHVKPHTIQLKEMGQKMGVLDFIRAKARFALSIGGNKPVIQSKREFTFKQLYHPMLFLHNNEKKKEVIPMDISLNSENRLMVVSGPNAGGKSVSIKTLATNQFLVQCGLLIPCAPDSSCCIFKQIFVDIGDSQSIENDLSSYSGHLTAMKYFVENSSSNTLVVIDEIGSGTDPNFGGAMAEAILLTLQKRQIMGMVTTHFGNIKTLANRTEGMINGSMAYDIDKLKPLYRLQTGIPGSSFALEVAKNIGLSGNIIELARKKSNTVEQKTDELLARLELEREQNQVLKYLMEKDKDHFHKLKSEYQQMKDDLQGLRKGILDDARKKALEILDNANASVERTIRDIKENKADKGKTQQIRNRLSKEKTNLSNDLRMDKPKVLKVAMAEQVVKLEPVVGSIVKIPNSEALGEIIEVRKDKAVVVAGIIKSTIPLADLIVVKSGKIQPKPKQINMDMIRTQAEFVMEKDVRGMRGEEAIKEIDAWMDKAIVVGSPQLRLIHGKGDGILKKLIRDYYGKSPYIKRINYESIELGGEGVSIIELK